MYHTEKQPTKAFRPLALTRMHDLELLDARDRLILAGLVGRHRRSVFAEQMAAIEGRLAREVAR